MHVKECFWFNLWAHHSLHSQVKLEDCFILCEKWCRRLGDLEHSSGVEIITLYLGGGS